MLNSATALYLSGYPDSNSPYLFWYSDSVLFNKSLVSTRSYGMFNISVHLVMSPPAREFMVLMYLNFSKARIPAFFSKTDGAEASSLFSISIRRDNA